MHISNNKMHINRVYLCFSQCIYKCFFIDKNIIDKKTFSTLKYLKIFIQKSILPILNMIKIKYTVSKIISHILYAHTEISIYKFT